MGVLGFATDCLCGVWCWGITTHLQYDLCKKIFNELDNTVGYKIASNKLKKRYKSCKPYWNERLSELLSTMTSSEKNFTRYRGNCQRLKIKLRQRYKMDQRVFDKELRNAFRAYNEAIVDKIENFCNSNHKEFRHHLKNLGPRTNSTIPIKVRNGDGYITDKTEVLNAWKDAFEGLLNPNNAQDEYDAFLREKQFQKYVFENAMDGNIHYINEELNSEISFHEIENVVSKLKTRKAVGDDRISNEVLKCKAVHLTLYKLFCLCFHTGMIPSVWRNALIKQIPKGSTKDPYVQLNYRGISLISCESKLYSSLINNRVIKYCNLLGLFPEEQNGFRQNRSCEDHIFSLSSIIKNRLCQKKDLFCAFIDLGKGFDWVNRDLLLYKLIEYGVDGNIYKAIKAILTGTTSCVMLNNEDCADWFENMSGVRQGDPLSPTLFSLFINDLARQLKSEGPVLQVGNTKINILLYAEDMVLFAENEENLQYLLGIMNDWCFKWRLKVNKNKTKIIHFRTVRKAPTNVVFKYGNDDLEVVSRYKYLGIILDEHLKFDTCSRPLAESGGRALGSVKKE